MLINENVSVLQVFTLLWIRPGELFTRLYAKLG